MSDHDPSVPDTSFVPQLDARQRAMLAEMGVKIWTPKTAPPPLAVAAGTTPAAVAEPAGGRQPDAAAAVAPAPSPATVAVRPASSTLTEPPATTPTRSSAPALAVSVSVTAPATSASGLAPRPAGIETMDWPTLQAAVAGCQACGLCRSRKNTVFGTGDVQADWMVVGEAPGENEDLQGEPFVGLAGQLLDNMLRAVGRSRTGQGAQGAYIANVLKCRPPANRNPQPAEVAQCEPYLARQVALVQPKIILALGRFAVQALLKTDEPIGRLRGQVHQFQGVPVIVSYHPAYLLRAPADKAKAWADLCLALDTVNTPLRR